MRSRCTNLHCHAQIEAPDSGKLIAVPLGESRSTMFLWLCARCCAALEQKKNQSQPEMSFPTPQLGSVKWGIA